MPRAGKITLRGGKNIDYYEIAMRQFQQQILPAGLPITIVWGYGPATARGGPVIFNAPSLTIEAKYNTPVRIKGINELVDDSGNYLSHLLSVDPTLHWANPPGGEMHRDRRPDFTGKTYVPLTEFTDPETQYSQYTGPVPIVTHLHSALNVGDESDGYAEVWYLPAANNLPAGYAKEGTWYDFFAEKASTKFGVAQELGSAIFQYPNTYRAATLWYHDHTLGMTRLNVYAYLAGFYIIRGGPSDEVFDSRTGATTAILPGPVPAIGDAPKRIIMRFRSPFRTALSMKMALSSIRIHARFLMKSPDLTFPTVMPRRSGILSFSATASWSMAIPVHTRPWSSVVTVSAY